MDADEKKKKKKKKKKPAKSNLFALLGGAVVVLLLCCITSGVGGFFAFKALQPPDIVGRWEVSDKNLGDARVIYEFRKDGTGEEEFAQGKVTRKNPFRYTQSSGSVNITHTLEGELPDDLKNARERRTVFSASRSGNTLYLDAGAKMTLTKID